MQVRWACSCLLRNGKVWKLSPGIGNLMRMPPLSAEPSMARARSAQVGSGRDKLRCWTSPSHLVRISVSAVSVANVGLVGPPACGYSPASAFHLTIEVPGLWLHSTSES